MSESQLSFDEYFERFYRRHARRVMAVVLRKLYRGQTDPEDVVQSILMSFAEQLRQDHLHEPKEEDDLWGPLLAVALRHCDKHNKRWTRGRAAKKFVVPFSTLEGAHDEGEASFDVAEERPDLEEVERDEWIDSLLDRLEQKGLKEEEIAVFRLKLAGHTIDEIAQQTGFTQGRVKTLLRHIRQTVEQLLDSY